MDIRTYCSDLEKQMKQQLTALHQASAAELSRIASRLKVINATLNELRLFIHKYKFANTAEEVHFFKEVKPTFLSQYFFQRELFRISLASSFMTADQKHVHFKAELKHLAAYAKRHRKFQLYCMSGDASQDQTYFTRSNTNAKPTRDALFSTGFDETLSMILSHAMLKDFILDEFSLERQVPALKWTGKKLDLVELIFALHATGNVNNVHGGIKPVADAFSKMFNVDLGNYHDYFQAIRSRKKAKLVFIDKLRSSLMAKFEELDER
jgi:hypothetical protein